MVQNSFDLFDLVFFFVAVMGLTAIIVDSSIAKWFKDKCRERLKPALRDSWLGVKVAEAANCYQCTGFWAGLLVGILLFDCPWYFWLCCGWAGSWVSVWGTLHLNYMEAQTLINLDDGEHRNT